MKTTDELSATLRGISRVMNGNLGDALAPRTNAETLLGNSPLGADSEVTERHMDIANALLRTPTVDTETERCIARHSDLKPLTVCFERSITQAELAAICRTGGIVLYPTYDGGVGARTVEQNQRVREQNAKGARARHYQGVEAEARAACRVPVMVSCSPFEPPEFRDAREPIDPDGDEQNQLEHEGE